MEKEFLSKIETKIFDQAGEVSAKCPSNIALIKYWGKKGLQIPMNPSLSFTLNESYTETKLKYSPKVGKEFSLKVFLDGELKEDFAPKILTFFDRIESYLPFLKEFDYEIYTHNTFPHSSGIASSASGMGALVLCLTEIENQLGGELNPTERLKKSSFLARLGSGSACRSVYPGITVWGETPLVERSSDLFAIPYPYEVHPEFHGFRDTILLLDEGKKSVSSTVGHQLMKGHPYAEARIQSVNENLRNIIKTLKTGDLEQFGRIVEHEALSLHAMMMTSDPSFILMKPSTLKVLENIRQFRQETDIPVYFTLDAGANVHVLYPNKSSEKTMNFITEMLKNSNLSRKTIKDFTK